MTVGEKMQAFRSQFGFSIESMAKKCDVGAHLLMMVEEDTAVVMPYVADRITKAYELSEEDREKLLPEHRRKSNPKYEPDKYESWDRVKSGYIQSVSKNHHIRRTEAEEMAILRAIRHKDRTTSY